VSPLRIVILGAGFAGLELATRLDGFAERGTASVTLVDRADSFGMGFGMQWAMMGRRSFTDGRRRYANRRAANVDFIRDDVVSIDPDRKTVTTNGAGLDFDRLVIALGAELTPEAIPGLAESGYNLCDPTSVEKMTDRLQGIDSGTVLVAVCSLPFKCPPAPYEYAFLVDELLRRRGVRQQVEVVISTPEPHPLPVAVAEVGAQVLAILQDRGITYLPQHAPVGFEAGTVTYENGAEQSFALLGAIPPHRAPGFLSQAGLTNTSGFVPVDLATLATQAEGVFAVGDVAAITLPNGKPHPKAGVFAEAQAGAVADLLTAELGGGEPSPYGGHGLCYIDVGNQQAAAAAADLLHPSGPHIELSPPSAEGLAAKAEFERSHLDRWFL